MYSALRNRCDPKQFEELAIHPRYNMVLVRMAAMEALLLRTLIPLLRMELRTEITGIPISSPIRSLIRSRILTLTRDHSTNKTTPDRPTPGHRQRLSTAPTYNILHPVEDVRRI